MCVPFIEKSRIIMHDDQSVMLRFHSQILMVGLPTPLDRAPGEPVIIRRDVHLLSDHVKAADTAGWILQEVDGRRTGR